jgi:hypothetical protein
MALDRERLPAVLWLAGLVAFAVAIRRLRRAPAKVESAATRRSVLMIALGIAVLVLSIGDGWDMGASAGGLIPLLATTWPALLATGVSLALVVLVVRRCDRPLVPYIGALLLVAVSVADWKHLGQAWAWLPPSDAFVSVGVRVDSPIAYDDALTTAATLVGATLVAGAAGAVARLPRPSSL